MPATVARTTPGPLWATAVSYTHLDVYKRQDLDRLHGGVHTLPPYEQAKGTDWYKGTANAIYQLSLIHI